MRRFLPFATITAVALALVAPAMADQQGMGDLTAEQHLVADVHSDRPGSMPLTAWVDHKSNTYRRGEAVSLFVKPGKNAYLAIISIDPSGNAVQLYPNAFDVSKRIKANHILEIPGPHAAAKIVAGGKPGTKLIRVIASSRPLDHRLPFKLTGDGGFQLIEGGAKAIAQDLQLIRTNDTVHYDKIIRTIAQTPPPPAAAPPSSIAPGQVVSTVLPPNDDNRSQKRPPILIAIDKQHYKPGELVTMAVTTMEPCYVWVVDVSSDKTASVLFPNKIVRDNQLKQAGTVVISGISSKVKIYAARPASQDTVYALCGRDSTPPWKSGVDFTKTFGTFDKMDPLIRTLVATASARPQAGTIPERYSWAITRLTVGK